MNIILLLAHLIFGAKYNCIEKQYFDHAGRVLSGGLIYFYVAGTNVPIEVYHDVGTIPTTIPVVLDASGHTQICGDMERAYSVTITDANNALVWQTGYNGSSYYFGGTAIYDTIVKIIKDTITIRKTDTLRDTTILHTLVHDTIKIDVPSKDTVIKTIYKIDTLKLRDTVNSCKVAPTYVYYGLYSSKHILPMMRGIQLFESNDSITWKNGGDNKNQNDFAKTVSIKIEANTGLDISVYIYDNSGVFVNSFESKIGARSNVVKYLTWGGMTADGKQVVDGVYVIRVLIRDGNRIDNNVYNVGVER